MFRQLQRARWCRLELRGSPSGDAIWNLSAGGSHSCRRDHTYHGAGGGAAARAASRVCAAAAVLEMRDRFYRTAALKYQRRGGGGGVGGVGASARTTTWSRLDCAAETDEQVYSAPARTGSRHIDETGDHRQRSHRVTRPPARRASLFS